MRFVYWLGCTAVLAAVPVLVPILLGYDSSLDDRVRWSGLILQLAGLFTVVVGLDASRELFGEPTFLTVARQTLKRLWVIIRSTFVAPKPRHVHIQPDSVELRMEIGPVRVTASGGPLDIRVTNLESDVNALWERFQKAESELKVLRRDASKGLEKETAERQEAERRIERKMKEAVIGGIHLELYGLGFLLVGITLATIPQEVAYRLESIGG